MHLRVDITGCDPYGLRHLCQVYFESLWISHRYSPVQTAAFALEKFRRSVLSRLAALPAVGEPDSVSGNTK